MTAPPRQVIGDAAVIEQSWHEPEKFAPTALSELSGTSTLS